MKPEATSFLQAADRALREARTILAADVVRQAARIAYFAQFHAAPAMIFERTGRIAKTHKGVNAQFHKLAAAEPGFDRTLAPSLTSAYHFKDAADYDTGELIEVTADDARTAITTAATFVTAVRTALSTPKP